MEAPPLVEKAMKLSPRDPAVGVFYWHMGRAFFYAGRYRDAIPWLAKSIEIQPYVWYNRLYLVSAYALADEKGEARKVLGEFDNNSRFSGYTVERVESNERANPNDNAVVVAAREKLHEGLLAAGMPAR